MTCNSRAAVLFSALVLVACKESPPADKGSAPAPKAAVPAANEIRVGGIFDLTGVTSDVGKSFAAGVRDNVQAIIDKGGING